MYKLFLFFFLIFSTQLNAQDSIVFRNSVINTSRFMAGIPFIEMGSRQAISINGDIGLQGNSIDGFALKHILIDDYITNDNKTSISGRLKDFNYAYYHQQYNISYYKKTSIKWLEGFAIHASKNTYANLEFNKDAFAIATSGNAAFENQTATLDNTKIQVASYYAAGGTLVFKLLKGQLYIGASCEGIEATNGMFMNLTNGSLYTAPYGEYIDANMNGDLLLPDTLHSNKNRIKGNGFRIGGFVEWLATDADIFTVNAQNLGQVYWNKSSLHFRVDTSIHFDGYNVSSLFNTSQSGLSFNSDSIAKIFHIHTRKATFTQNLIPLFTFQYVHLARRINTTFGLNASLCDNIEYSSSLKGFGQYHFKNKWTLGASVTYYAGNMVATGIMASKSWNHFHVYLSSDNFLQYWNFSNITNESVAARLSYNF